MKLIFFILAILVGVNSLPVIIQSEPKADIDFRLLEEEIFPLHYEIEIIPYLDDVVVGTENEFTFDGKTTIQLDVTVAGRNTLKLNTKYLEYTSMKLMKGVGGKAVEIEVASTPIDEYEMMEITFPEDLVVGNNYYLTFEYVGQMMDDMGGFYRSFYMENGSKVWLGTTQFQRTHARRVFPSFDEPKYKATISLTILAPEGYNAISNTESTSSDLEQLNGKTRTRYIFSQTPKMSTYLLAFIVSKFEPTSDGVSSLNVWSRPEQKEQAKYASEVGPKILQKLGEFLDFDYYDMIGMTKMDMAAIPDFSAGAMENWGLLTYREASQLYDPDETALITQQRIAAVIAHEQAHMWFGDLVTCDWWSVTWLNEGFARYFQYFGTAWVENTWELEKQFPVEQIQAAFLLDSTKGTHPLTDPSVNTPAQSSAMFDNISYNKGAAFIRMVEHVIGTDKLQLALQNYLKDRQYDTGLPSHLFEQLQAVVQDDFPEFTEYFQPWTEKSGYPLVTVTVSADRKTADISQSRFWQNPDDAAGEEDTIWSIPLTFTTKNKDDGFDDTHQIKWLLTAEEKDVQIDAEDSWVIFNIQQTGFYRVNYDSVTWSLITEALKSDNFEDIHEVNRAQIVDDVLQLARAGVVKYEFALDLLSYLSHETSYFPWLAAFNGFSYLTSRMDAEALVTFKLYLGTIIRQAYKLVGFERDVNESRVVTYLRTLILNWACKIGHQDCTAKSREAFNKFKDDSISNPVEVNIRSAVYCSALRDGDLSDFDKLWNKYMTEQVSNEQVVILNSLGCARDSSVIAAVINKLLSADVRSQDRRTAISSTYTNTEENLDVVYSHLKENYLDFENGFGDKSGAIATFSSIASRFTSQEQIDDLKKFVVANSAYFEDSLTSAITNAEKNLVWINNNVNGITTFIEESMANNWRLHEEEILPLHYEIEIIPYLDDVVVGTENEFTFDGKTTIQLDVTVAGRNTLKLNTKYLEYTSMKLMKGVGGSAVEIGVTKDPLDEFEMMEITFDENLVVANDYYLTFEYIGQMMDDMGGFYKSSYMDNGQTIWLGSTQFQRMHARRVFPCFDEPHYKAEFSLTILAPEDYHAISNMEISSEMGENLNGKLRTRFVFNPTPKMSSYLLAFIVSKFESTSDGVNNLNVWSRREQKEQAKYASEVGPKILDRIGQFLDFDYYDMDGMTKMDMAAIPDFQAGAMENWGLLTYRESRLLYDPIESELINQQRIAAVIAHEQAHMWFGDLVTCAWWSVTWLNEGFATYFQYFGTAWVEDKWELEKQFTVEQIQPVLLFDSTTSTHPMTDHSVNTPAESGVMFDSISYNKGASIIRMMQYVVGEESFKLSLHNYLVEMQKNSAVPEDLFLHFQTVVQDELPSFTEDMKPWTEVSGYPLVTVKVSADRKTADISQSRFWQNPEDADAEKTIWSIPLTFTTFANGFDRTTPSIWLKSEEAKGVTINAENSWVIFNLQQTGYYRVNYDSESWSLIVDTLKSDNFKDIHEVNRAQIVDDVLQLARAGVVKYDFAFDLLTYLSQEESYFPWLSAFNSFSVLTSRMELNSLLKFKIFLSKIIEPIYEKVGFDIDESEKRTLTYLRSHVLNWACKINHKDCRIKARERFMKFKDEGVTINANIRSAVYCSVMRDGDITDFNVLWEKYLNEQLSSEQVLILNSLGCAKDENVLTAVIDKILSVDVRLQDKRAALTALYTGTEENLNFVYEYAKINYLNIETGFGSRSDVISTFSSIASRFTSQDQIDNLKQMVNENRDYYGSSLDSAILSAETNLKWIKKYVPDITDFIDDYFTKSPEWRLNEEGILPTRYDIQITPYLDVIENDETKFTFDGIVTIHLNVVEAGRYIMNLNTKYLKYSSAILMKGSTSIGVTITPVDEYEMMRLAFDSPLDIGEDYSLTFEYTGEMMDDMGGFYRSYYMENDVKIWLGTTQMQTTDARRVFPCFDEPHYKATFSLIINAPDGYHAISNMESLEERTIEYNGKARTQYTFNPTPKMSSYLLAFIVSKFESTSDGDSRLKVWSRKDQKGQAKYASVVGPQILEKIGEFLDFDYYDMVGMNKMDMAAIPDFSAGAMENWGLLTYREASQLYDPNETALITKQRIAAVIAHEQAHMWFGDLVTCDWWSVTWLNEGFARYFQYFATSWVEDKWELEKQFTVEQIQTAFLLDSTKGTHPMTDPSVNTPTQASNMFDNISYNKGAAILRMIEHAIGTEKFKTALRNYVADRKYDTGLPSQLFQHFQDVVGTEISFTTDIQPWTENPGYPIITVLVSDDRKTAAIGQSRFWQNPMDAEGSSIWSIPITFTTRTKTGGFENTTPSLWLKNSVDTNVQINAENSWVIFNLKQTGFYRVNYDVASWKLIVEGLKADNFDNIDEINRAQIVDDTLQFARAGVNRYNFTFDLLTYLEKEDSYFPWLSAFNSFSYLTSKMDSDALNKFKLYLIEIMKFVYEKVGFERDEDESATTTYLRTNVLNWACKSGHKGCISEARQLFDKLKADESVPVEVNIRSAVYCSAMREGDMSDFEFLWNKYKNEEVSSEQVVILNALGCARNEAVLTAAINAILSDDVRLQDKRGALTSTYTNTEENLDTVYKYAKSHYPTMGISLGGKSEIISVFSSIAGRFTSPDQIEDLKAFASSSSAYFNTSLESAITNAETNLLWIEENISQITTFLDDYLKSSAVTISYSMMLVMFSSITMYFMY